MALTEQEEFELLSLERERTQAKAPNPQSGTNGFFRQAANVLSTPFRGYRGLAVGAENLAATGSPSGALARAAEAVQPGFQPKGIAESLASGVGESVPLLPLAGLGGASALGRAAAQGAIGAGYSAIQQGSDKGQINPLEVAGSAALMGLPHLAGPLAEGMESAGTNLGRRALGYTKRLLNKPGAVSRANDVAKTMMDEGVVRGMSGAEATLERAIDLKEKSGRTIGAINRLLHKNGAKGIDTREVVGRVIDQLSPKEAVPTMGAYAQDSKALEEVVDTIHAHGDGPISLESTQRLKNKLQDLGKFHLNTDSTKAEMYRRASGVVREAQEKSILDAARDMKSKDVLVKFLRAKELNGKAQEAIKAITNRVSSEAGNKAVGLTDTIAAAGELAHGSPMGALELLGTKRAFERYGAATLSKLLRSGAKSVSKAKAAAAPVGLTTMQLLRQMRKRYTNEDSDSQ